LKLEPFAVFASFYCGQFLLRLNTNTAEQANGRDNPGEFFNGETGEIREVLTEWQHEQNGILNLQSQDGDV
jgi:hypothetical protein